MNRNKPAARRAELINLLWEFKHKLEPQERLDFSVFLSDPVYRAAALERHRHTRSTRLQALLSKITELDPHTDLGPENGVTAFINKPVRRSQPSQPGTGGQQRYVIGAGLMLIGIVVLIGLLTIYLAGAENTHVVQPVSAPAAKLGQADTSQHERRLLTSISR